jgi:hypothetical protein
MSNILICKNSHFVLSYIQADQWIYAEWIGEQTLETVIYNCKQITDAVKKYACTKVLNDNRRLSGNWVNAIDWVEKEWIPNLFIGGCEYFAWVQSECLRSQASVQETVKLNFRNIKVLIFDDIEAAKAWLWEH